MEFTAQQIADYLGGKVDGDANIKVSNFSKIEEGTPGTLTFLSNPKYTHFIYDTQASIVLVNNDFVPEKSLNATLIRVADAYKSLASLMTMVEQSASKKVEISPLAYISESAIIGENVYIAPFVFVGERVKIGKNTRLYPQCSLLNDVEIGDNTTLYANVSVYEKCVVGNNCIIHSSTVIGSDGFGFAPSPDGSYKKIPQLGNVIVENNVEIGSNCSIDRATLGSTILRQGVKIDNLIQIAHNVEIGQNTVMAAQSGVAGSSKIGNQCIIAGQVGIAGHLQIIENTTVAAQAGVTASIKKGNQTVQGSPAIPLLKFQRSSVVFKNLPELQKNVFELQKQIQELENRINRISQ